MAERDDTVTASHLDAAAAATLPPPPDAGPYRCLERLGAGGMGEVFRARDEVLRRDIAVKRLSSERAGDAGARVRMLREARAQAAVAHPNLCTIYQAGEDTSGVWIAMELLPGPTLGQIGRAGPVPERRLVPLALGIARALAAAHAAGLVHRDLKPGNVMLDGGGHPKLLDFGLAKVVAPIGGGHSLGDQTGEGAVMGTPRYMSPEQAKGASVDARSDVFSLGVVLYELRAGIPPFGGETPIEVIAAIVRDDAVPLARLVPDVTPALAELIHGCLARDPAERPTAAVVATRLEQVAAGISATASRTAATPPPARRRGRVAAIAAAVAIVAVASVGAALLLGGHRGPTERRLDLPLSPEYEALVLAPGGRVFTLAPDQTLWVSDAQGKRRIDVGVVHGVWCCARDRVLVDVEGDPAVLELDPATLATSPATDYLAAAGSAQSWAPSPDGTRLVTLDGDHLQVREVGGSAPPLTIATASAGQRIWGGTWSPDGTLIAYVRSPDQAPTLEVVAAAGGPTLATVPFHSDGDLGRWTNGAVWIGLRSFTLADMRVDATDLVRVDLDRDGRERSRRVIRHAPGRTLEVMSYRDGKLALAEHTSVRTVETGDLSADGRLGPLTRIGGDTDNGIAGWTADGRLVFGRWHRPQIDVVVQLPGGVARTLIGATTGHRTVPIAVSDRFGVVYIDHHDQRASLVRADLSGVPTPVAELEVGDQVGCGAAVCVRFHGSAATVLDLATGHELGGFAVHDPTSPPAVAADDTRIAYASGGAIVVRDRASGAEQTIQVAGAGLLQHLSFSPDPDVYYATDLSYAPGAFTLLRIGPAGRVLVLSSNGPWYSTPRPSPDGKRLGVSRFEMIARPVLLQGF